LDGIQDIHPTIDQVPDDRTHRPATVQEKFGRGMVLDEAKESGVARLEHGAKGVGRDEHALLPGKVIRLHDHIYVDNLVHAEILIAKHLVPESPVCGKAYFVTDNHPIHMFEFMRPFVEGLGYKFPKIDVPYRPMLVLMRLWQFLHFRIGLPRPLFTPHELRKLTISHVATSSDAERDFGYRPIVRPEEAMTRCVAHYRERLATVKALAPPQKGPRKRGRSPFWKG